MKRWAPWFVAVACLCALVFARRSESPDILKDTDTVALLARIREVGDPTAWFKGDWPLQNHFYRPVSTLAFEMDNALFGDVAAGYARTNALLAVMCVLLLFWFLREATDVPWLTGASTLLFACWHLGHFPVGWAANAFAWLAPVCLLGMPRGGSAKLPVCLFALFGCLFLSSQMFPAADFSDRIVRWLPGRTASVMAVFALFALACYSRYVRVTAQYAPPPATALDLPATKSATVARPARGAFGLVVLSLVGVVLALCSYEQAVMLPALLFGVWVSFRVRGQFSSGWPHVWFWLVLGAYLALRAALVPSDVSGYQDQQFRSGVGVWVSLGDYLLPSALLVYASVQSLALGWASLLVGSVWMQVGVAVGNWTSYWKGWCDAQWRWPLAAFLFLSFVAFLPMAWLHPFGHYHYLPSALRAPFVVILAAVVLKLVVSAASLPELRAPVRRDPAPGSLPRP